MADILTPILLFIMGLILLGKGSDYFVESAARIAKYFGVSESIIGLTLLAVGTSLPELGASIIAAYSGNPEIVLGNVVGSNIANIGLILGISAVITTLLVDPEIFKRDMYLLMGVSLIFYLFVLDAVVSTFEGILLLLFFLLYISFLFKFKPRFVRVFHFRQYFDYYFDFNQMLDLETYTRILMKSIDPRTHIRLMKIGFDVGLTPLRIAQKGLSRGN
ncbi:MAG: sodium:calcium antiporter, partial [Candidatus Altiarchaeales archaeon]|nr:sodium:calcium antiporter [Candidatus Altiarchaeales archaeon]